MLGLCTKSYADWETLSCKELGKVTFRDGELYSRVVKDPKTCQEKAYEMFPNDAERQYEAMVWCIGEEAINPSQRQAISYYQKEGFSLKLNKSAKKFAFNSDHLKHYWDCPHFEKCPEDTKAFSVSSDGLTLYYMSTKYKGDICPDCDFQSYMDYRLDTQILRTGTISWSYAEGTHNFTSLVELKCEHR